MLEMYMDRLKSAASCTVTLIDKINVHVQINYVYMKVIQAHLLQPREKAS